MDVQPAEIEYDLTRIPFGESVTVEIAVQPAARANDWPLAFVIQCRPTCFPCGCCFPRGDLTAPQPGAVSRRQARRK